MLEKFTVEDEENYIHKFTAISRIMYDSMLTEPLDCSTCTKCVDSDSCILLGLMAQEISLQLTKIIKVLEPRKFIPYVVDVKISKGAKKFTVDFLKVSDVTESMEEMKKIIKEGLPKELSDLLVDKIDKRVDDFIGKDNRTANMDSFFNSLKNLKTKPN